MNISPSSCPKVADEMLCALHDVCQARDMRWFVHQGTCLGFYRDGAWLEDNDIDAAVICSDEDYQNIWKELEALPGWDAVNGLRKGLVQLDLQRVDPEPPYIPPGWKPNPFSCVEFDTVEYNGIKVPVPSPVEKYLQWEYTAIWKVPVPREIWIPMVDWMQRRIEGKPYEY